MVTISPTWNQTALPLGRQPFFRLIEPPSGTYSRTSSRIRDTSSTFRATAYRH